MNLRQQLRWGGLWIMISSVFEDVATIVIYAGKQSATMHLIYSIGYTALVLTCVFIHIAQEALNNSLKHAEATSVTVKLRTADGNVELEIADNGKGFEKESVDDKGGMGLGNIKERSEALGGQWSITSQPNEGTRVWIRVPVIKSN